MSTSRLEHSSKPYHHGHLRQALVDAALAAARTGGPDAVVLRAATRAAGVSPNAAYRHFADRDDLLGAVAIRCQALMAVLMADRLDAVAPDGTPERAWVRLRASGRAYVDFALSEPGWFHTGFAIPLGAQPAAEGSGDLYAILVGVLDDLADTGGIPPTSRAGAELVAWSAVHGIATLLTGGPLRDLPAGERDAAVERIVNAVAF